MVHSFIKPHSKDKNIFKAPFLVLQFITNRGFVSVLEGPIRTWNDNNRNIGFQMDKDIPIVVLPGTDWSFQVVTLVPYL